MKITLTPSVDPDLQIGPYGNRVKAWEILAVSASGAPGGRLDRLAVVWIVVI
jgi:hypothetical protein